MAKKKSAESSAPEMIHELVAKFNEHQEVYRRGDYNETMLRRDFLDPFFAAMGWDIDNRKGYSEAYREVIHEDSLRVEMSVKAPDYCFRIGGQRKFFVEAKKPSVNIKDDVAPAFQLRRYAWTAKLPLSILSDFEELAVYDCRIKPDKADKASVARVMLLKYTEYVERWEELAAIFSPEAINKGSFDKYAKSQKKKRGTAEVDEAFLEEIEEWRESLAKNLSLRNESLSDRELNFSVQRIIDRIIFLRMCEGRGIEPYGRLQALLNGTGSYGRLVEMFHRADEKYNSGLFHFHKEKGREPPDTLTTALVVDDKVLKEIVRRLYYPESPYEFAALPADILGQVYEQFLGKVIRRTKGHRAKIEEKPEVRKAGGVYYTPTYIVNYIVENTVGKLLEGKTPQEVGGLTKTYQLSKRGRPLTVLDPACGSGSFLIVAYQYLLDWYLKQYTEMDKPTKHDKGKNPRVCQSGKGEWRLTMSERKRILLSHIYGVDIDYQAVEVSKLSLLLKVLEGETEDSLQRQLVAFHKDRALPDLTNNIKCGNSLIGPDFYQGQQLDLFDEEERLRINVFDWEAEFAEIMQSGGFDAVLGNPPWGAEFTEEELEYHRRKNRTIIVRMIDSFMYFVNQCLEKLTSSGRFGMILPDVVLYQKDNEKIRRRLMSEYCLEIALNMGDVFEKVTRPTAIVVASMVADNSSVTIADFTDLKKIDKPTHLKAQSRFCKANRKQLLDLPNALIVTRNLERYEIWRKLLTVPHHRLSELVDEDGIQRGVSPDLKDAFLVDSAVAKQYSLEREKLRPVLTGGRHVKRYRIERPNLWLIYTSRSDDFKSLPQIRAYIDQFKESITCKEVKQGKHPLYALHRPRDEKIFVKKEKLIGVITEDEIVIAPDDQQAFVTDGLYLFGVRDNVNSKFVIGILNSRLFVFIYRLLTLERGRVLAQVKPTILVDLPISKIECATAHDTARHDRLVQSVERLLSLHEQNKMAKTPHNRTVIQRQIEATDQEIDRLVYELYGLTDKEIAIVEEATSK